MTPAEQILSNQLHSVCGLTGLETVETASQQEINKAYTDFLVAQVRRQRSVMREAALYCSIGDTRRAWSVLSQGVQS